MFSSRKRQSNRVACAPILRLKNKYPQFRSILGRGRPALTLLAFGVLAGLTSCSSAPKTADAGARQRTLLDTVVVPVSLLDDKGRLVPDSGNRISFQVHGTGRLLGVGNGNPSDHDTDRANERNAFHGHCIALVQAGSRAGNLKLTATSPGLAPAEVTFRVR